MHKFEILDRMAQILQQEVNALVPGMISDFLIEAPITQWFGNHVEIKITARQLKWNTWLGGVSRKYSIDLFERYYPELREPLLKKVDVDPYLWERFQRIVCKDIEEMILKLIRMIKEYENGKTD